ncbi:hypothetical protein FHL15_010016 [Xylaria flabelliformis]|uniref:Translation initiation factor 3 C-terminal domain-containing protein n=1 Tax=Xylaria flabelliformis TaxID=2512241 RepID=A0A553HMB4_9PEZI|nr:hypothetical protein FHL15_010016 [Xylaria flabelliformis]
MRHTQCLLTPARALHRVFLVELAKSNGISSTILPSSSAFRKCASLPPSKRAHTQGITTASPCCRSHPFSTTSAAAAQRMIVKHPRDEKIPYRWVRIAGESQSLSEPQPIDAVLASLPPGHSLVMVAPPPPPNDETAGVVQPSAAICRIIDAVAEAAARKEAAKEAKKTAQQTKTLELNWAIAPHDLAHKLKRLDEFLAKGMRVELLLARKRKSRKASAEEGGELIRRVKEAASDAGATEYKKEDGYVGNVLRLFFEGPNKKTKS